MAARSDAQRFDPVVAIALGLALLTLLYLLAGTLPAARDLAAMHDENEATAREVLTERARRKALEDRLVALEQDPYYVEREARRTLNLVRPGERVIVQPGFDGE